MKLLTTLAIALVLMAGPATMVLAKGATSRPAFALDMLGPEVRAVCPHALVTLYTKLHTDTHFVCFDGARSTVLIFDDNGKLASISNLPWFAKQSCGTSCEPAIP